MQVGQHLGDVLTLNPLEVEFYNSRGTVMQSPPESLCPVGQTCRCRAGTNITGRPDTGRLTGIDDIHQNFTVPWGMALTILSALGILITFILFVFLLAAYPDRGGTSPVGFLLLFGVMLIYAVNFAFILQPGPEVCGVRLFFQGYVYALCFACMLVKCLVNWQLMDREEQPPLRSSGPYERVMHPACLFFSALAISLVQAGFAIEYLILRMPEMEWATLPGGEFLARCAESDFRNQDLLISCVYVMFLILLTFIFSVITWGSEENVRESRWILFTTLLTAVLWVLWGLLSCILELQYRDPTIAIANLLNATLILAAVFFRKIYLMNKYKKEEEGSQFSVYLESDRKSK